MSVLESPAEGSRSVPYGSEKGERANGFPEAPSRLIAHKESRIEREKTEGLGPLSDWCFVSRRYSVCDIA